MNNQVLKKLRNKFFSLLVFGFSTIIFLGFAIVYLTLANRINIENRDKLDSWIEPDEKNNDTDFLTIEIDENGEIVEINSEFQMTDKQYEELVNLVLNQSLNSNEITLENRTWMYAIRENKSLIPFKRDQNPIDEVLTEDEVVIKSEKVQEIIVEPSGEIQDTIDEPSNGSINYSVSGFWFSTVENFYEYMLGLDVANHHNIIFLDITDSRNELSDLFITLLSAGILMFFAIIIISAYFSKRAIKPIAESVETQKQFIVDASHGLKTPLMIINSNYDVLLDNKEETIESQIKWMEYIKFGTERMTNLTNDLLALARFDQPNLKIKKNTFDINKVISDVISTLEAKSISKELSISKSMKTPFIINQDIEKITQVIFILLDNAIKYTNHKGWIEITTLKTKRHITFTIKNSGPGIAKEHIPKIFDRFYHSNASRNSESKSYGLGLAIAKAIIEKLDGKIWVTSVENEVTTFSFKVKI